MASDTVQTEPQIDPRAALAALGYTETTEPQRVKGGWETLLWRFATPDGREHSLRVHHLPDRVEFARRERLALPACEEGGLPAPRPEAAGDGALLVSRPASPLLRGTEALGDLAPRPPVRPRPGPGTRPAAAAGVPRRRPGRLALAHRRGGRGTGS